MYKITEKEKFLLKNSTPICKPLLDGRILNIKTNKLDTEIKGGSIFEITTPQGKVLLIDSFIKCINIISVSCSNLIKRIKIV